MKLEIHLKKYVLCTDIREGGRIFESVVNV